MLVACSGVVTPFKVHCRLGHHFLSLLKNSAISLVFEPILIDQ